MLTTHRFRVKSYSAGEFEGVVYATITCYDGSVFKGTFTENTDRACGRMLFSNGGMYEGHLYKGMQHGNGKATGRDGSVMEGVWRHGEYVHYADIEETLLEAEDAFVKIACTRVSKWVQTVETYHGRENCPRKK